MKVRLNEGESECYVYSDGVVVRAVNRRIVVRSHKRARGGVLIELFSVNNDNAKDAKHIHQNTRLKRKYTALGLSFDALRDLVHAVSLYDEYIEPISQETFWYKSLKKTE